jgi:hypothetical protein
MPLRGSPDLLVRRGQRGMAGLITGFARAADVAVLAGWGRAMIGPWGLPRDRASAPMESVLGATPREFESRILRHPQLRRRNHSATLKLSRHRDLSQLCLIFGLGTAWLGARSDGPPRSAQPLWMVTDTLTHLNGRAHAPNRASATQPHPNGSTCSRNVAARTTKGAPEPPNSIQRTSARCLPGRWPSRSGVGGHSVRPAPRLGPPLRGITQDPGPLR